MSALDVDVKLNRALAMPTLALPSSTEHRLRTNTK